MPTPLTDAINALTTYANETTGASDTTLSDAVETLVAGYGQGGDPYELARKLANGTITEYIDPLFTGTVRSGAFQNCYDLQTVQIHGATGVSTGAFNDSYTHPRHLLDLAFPNVTSIGGYQCQNWKKMRSLDLTKCTSIGRSFEGCSYFTVLILRKSDAIVTLGNSAGFYNTPFVNAGGMIYIPKALYDHLGDGTSLDYQNATNWSTVHGWGHTTWAQIEGSQYENYYVDGTPIE